MPEQRGQRRAHAGRGGEGSRLLVGRDLAGDDVAQDRREHGLHLGKGECAALDPEQGERESDGAVAGVARLMREQTSIATLWRASRRERGSVRSEPFAASAEASSIGSPKPTYTCP